VSRTQKKNEENNVKNGAFYTDNVNLLK